MKRDLSYDGLRGWLLIIIACNHLYGSFVPQFTRAPFGLVTAAEGFVFLSGFVAYLVYRRLTESPVELKSKVWRRSFTIYRFHISAVLITFTFMWLFPLFPDKWTNFFNAANGLNEPFQALLSALILLEQPGYHDILVLYLVPMTLLPMAILAIKNGKAIYVALASIVIWIFAQFTTVELIQPLFNSIFSDIKINVSYFDPFAWQIYFYMGVLLSYLKFDKGYRFDFSLPIKTTILSLAALLFALKHWAPEVLAEVSFGHGEAAIPYQINLLLLVYVFMLLMQHLPWLFNLRYPVFLGQHALPVFSFHAVIIYFLLPWSQPFITVSWYWDLLVCILFVGLLSIPAKLDQLWRERKQPLQNNVMSPPN